MIPSLDDAAYFAVREAFDAPWPGPRGDCVRLSGGDLTLAVYPADGCRIASFTAFGHELLRQWTPERRAFQYGAFPMIPWVGRLREGRLRHQDRVYALPVNKPPHALHGMACFAPWTILDVAPSSASFRFALGDPWPWRGDVVQTMRLSGNTLAVTLTVRSAEQSFPAAAGWHPWFRKELEPSDPSRHLQVRFSADWQEEPGPDELPTGRRITPRSGPWDDCFGFTGGMSARLSWPGRVCLDMVSPASSMVVFDKQPDATCVEPLSGPPDCVNTAPRLVSPDNPLVVSMAWTLRRDASVSGE